MNRISRKVAAPFIAIVLMAVPALSVSHDFTHAQDGHIGYEEIVIDGITYKRTVTDFKKISPLPEEATIPSVNDEDIIPQYLPQDPYPSPNEQTVPQKINDNKKSETKNKPQTLFTIQGISKALDSAVKKTGDWIFTKTIEYNRNRGTWVATPEQGIRQIVKDMNDFYSTNYTAKQIAKMNGVSDVSQIKTGNTFRIGTLDGWQPPSEPSNIDEEYWNGLNETQQEILKVHKNFYQSNLPDNMNQLNRNEWSQPRNSIAHNIGTSGNVEVRGKGVRIGQQAVYSPDGKRVDSPENMGTFDLMPPKLGNYVAHLRVDVKPWLNFGNSPADTTTYSQRVDAMSKTRGGRAALVYFSLLKLIEK